ncbi:MAG: NADH-quinone oxidoreductase subunit N [Acidobacteriota bacterium]
MNLDWHMAAPLLVLAAAGSALLLLALRRGATGNGLPYGLALGGLGLSALTVVSLLADASSQRSAFGGMLVMDRPALLMAGIVLGAAALAVLLSRQYLQRSPAPVCEYYALILFAAVGMIAMAATNNLVVMFVGLEVLSVALYVLVGITRTWERALEASMKYFILGAFSTAFILYGMAFLYGVTGSLDLMSMGRSLNGMGIGKGAAGAGAMILLGVSLMMVGLAFKIAAVPFHWWAPDVYEGAPTPVTAFMAVGTKGVAFVALLRVMTVAFGNVLVPRWTLALAVLALLSMVLGNLVALTQRNVKRMLAYSAVAHAGYLLVAVAAGSDLGSSALLFYFASYLLTTVGAFGVTALVAETGQGGDEGYGLLRYAGLGRSHPALALAMTIFMISLTGVPPTSGFLGKYFIFQAAMERALAGSGLFLILAAAGLLTSVVSAAYYLRVVVVMYMQKPDGEIPHIHTAFDAGLALGVAAAGILLLGLFPSFIYGFTRNVHSALQALALMLAS